MRNIKSKLVLLAFATFLCCCSEENSLEEGFVSKDAYDLTLRDSVFNVNSNATTLNVNVIAHGVWKATTNDKWISFDAIEKKGNGQLILNLSANNDKYYPRTGHVYLQSGSIKRTIEVNQEPSGMLTVKVGDVSFKMIPIEHGSFTMGKDTTAHNVTLTKDFKIGQTEVTQALWTVVTGKRIMSYISLVGSKVPGWDYSGNNGSRQYGDNFPASCIDREDALLFISKLNELTGLKFRMLTEAEWEFAAKGGVKSKGYKFSGSDVLEEITNPYSLQPIASKKPNEIGLYDMTGNVEEMVSDWYGPLSKEPVADPTGPSKPLTTDNYYVVKGMSYAPYIPDKYLFHFETSERTYRGGYLGDDETGLRLAL